MPIARSHGDNFYLQALRQRLLGGHHALPVPGGEWVQGDDYSIFIEPNTVSAPMMSPVDVPVLNMTSGQREAFRVFLEDITRDDDVRLSAQSARKPDCHD